MAISNKRKIMWLTAVCHGRLFSPLCRGVKSVVWFEGCSAVENDMALSWRPGHTESCLWTQIAPFVVTLSMWQHVRERKNGRRDLLINCMHWLFQQGFHMSWRILLCVISQKVGSGGWQGGRLSGTRSPRAHCGASIPLVQQYFWLPLHCSYDYSEMWLLHTLSQLIIN